jgi:hypothetical protein
MCMPSHAITCNLQALPAVQCPDGVFRSCAVRAGGRKPAKQHNLLDDMHFKHNVSGSLTAVALGAMLALGFLVQAKAEDKKADPSGNWTWTMQGGQGAERKVTAKFKVDGNKVTGTLKAPGRNGQTTETEIQDGTIKGDELSFTTVRERNGNKMTMKYHGKVTADSIKGKIESERNGEPTSRDWEAKRGDEKEK